MSDAVNSPEHYKQHPSGVECIEITEHMNFNLGNAVKYIWRAGLKGDNAVEDLEKAAWYVRREIERVSNQVVTHGECKQNDREFITLADIVREYGAIEKAKMNVERELKRIVKERYG